MRRLTRVFSSRANGCAYFSGLVILEVNLYEYPSHEHVDGDLELTRYCMDIFDRMTDESTVSQMKRLGTVVVELHRRSRLAVEEARRSAEPGEPQRLATNPGDHVQSIGATLTPGRDNGQAPTELEVTDADLQWEWGDSGGLETWMAIDDIAMVSLPYLKKGE